MNRLLLVKLTAFLLFFILFVKGMTSAQSSLYTETGIASYYADKFQGRKTSCGEKYDCEKFTAAHRTIPIGSKVKVTNLANKKYVIVRINDRGPQTNARVIDLSLAAAREISVLQSGLAKVFIEVIEDPNMIMIDTTITKVLPDSYKPGFIYDAEGKVTALNGYGIQLVSLQSSKNLLTLMDSLKQMNLRNIYIQVSKLKNIINYRIIVGKYNLREEAVEMQQKLKATHNNCFIKKY